MPPTSGTKKFEQFIVRIMIPFYQFYTVLCDGYIPTDESASWKHCMCLLYAFTHFIPVRYSTAEHENIGLRMNEYLCSVLFKAGADYPAGFELNFIYTAAVSIIVHNTIPTPTRNNIFDKWTFPSWSMTECARIVFTDVFP